MDAASPRLAGEVTSRIWPCVELQWEWLGGLPKIRTAAIVGAGSMGTAVATVLHRAGLEVQLGCRTAAQAKAIRAAGENALLPGVALPAGMGVSVLQDIEFAGVDFVVFAVPSASLPAAVGQVGAGIAERSAVLTLAKGLVAPLGATPTHYVAERVRARAVACLAGPAHAAEAVRQGAHVVAATADADFRRQLADVLRRGGLAVEVTDDVLGTELAACAKNTAALAASAASAAGMNAAGAAAGRVFAEVHELARTRGARSETFVGLAGAGDLVGTTLAAESRNRRAGELLGQGVPADRIAAMIGARAEALDSLELLAGRFDEGGIVAPATRDLRDLAAGRLRPEEWVATLRHPAEAARRAA